MKINQLQIGYTTTLLEISSMELVPGKVYGLVGGNGRGKTTLLQTLIGNIPPISGTLRIKENNICTFTAIEKAKTFGFVKSRFDGVSYMRAKEYVALGRTPHTNAFGRLTPKDEELVLSSLAKMGVSHLADKFTTELSDGERQMLAIAKVLAQETDYIFLDEPTAFLDYSNKKKVLELLVKIAKEENKAVLFSSHDLEMVLHYSDEVICVPKRSNQLEVVKKLELQALIELSF
jgi:iron complex transport system ATP-binding protein